MVCLLFYLLIQEVFLIGWPCDWQQRSKSSKSAFVLFNRRLVSWRKRVGRKRSRLVKFETAASHTNRGGQAAEGGWRSSQFPLTKVGR